MVGNLTMMNRTGNYCITTAQGSLDSISCCVIHESKQMKGLEVCKVSLRIIHGAAKLKYSPTPQISVGILKCINIFTLDLLYGFHVYFKRYFRQNRLRQSIFVKRRVLDFQIV